MVLTVFGGIAEFECSLIADRTEEGRRAAQARGVPFGRPPKLRPDQRTLAPELSLKKENPSAKSARPSMSMSQRSVAVSTTRRSYDSTPFLSHARSVKAVRDEDAGVFRSESDIVCLHIEAETFKEFREVTADIALELILENHVTNEGVAHEVIEGAGSGDLDRYGWRTTAPVKSLTRARAGIHTNRAGQGCPRDMGPSCGHETRSRSPSHRAAEPDRGFPEYRPVALGVRPASSF